MAKGRHVPVKLGLVCDEFAVQYCDLLKMPELFGTMVCCDVDPPAFDGTIPTLITLNLVQNDNIYDASVHFSTGGRISNYTLINAPAWMTINRYNGVISGTPTPDAATDYLNVQVQGSNSAGDAASNTFTMSVTANAPVFSGGPIPPISVQEDQAITPPISMAGYFTTGGPVETYSLTNAPLWLDIDPVTGELSGTPTTGADALGVTINATNVDGTDSSNAFDITVVDVVDAPIYSGVPIPPINGNVGVAITPYDVAAGGHFIGEDPPTVYQLFNAPPGITINASTGVIEGTPTVSGVFSTLYVRASNNAGSANSNTFTADISAQVLPLFSRPFSETASLEDDATYARVASDGSVTDFEGVIRTAGANEARFEGARRIENLVDTTSEHFGASSVWIPSSGGTGTNPVVTENYQDGHDRVQFDKGAAPESANLSSLAHNTAKNQFLGDSVFTFRMKSLSGTADIALRNTRSGFDVVTVTTDWQTFAYSGTDDTFGDGQYQILLRGTFGTSDTADILIDWSQIQNKTGSSTPTIPDEYVSVGVLSSPWHGAGVDGVKYSTFDNSGNSVDPVTGIVTEAQGSPLSGISLLMEPAATNYADGTHDFGTGFDVIDLDVGDYTFSLYGTAAMHVTNGSAVGTWGGSVTEGNPVTFNVSTAGTVVVALDSGTLDIVSGSQAYQIEDGAVVTSLIPTYGTPLSRAVDTLQYPLVTPQTEGMAIMSFAESIPQISPVSQAQLAFGSSSAGPLCRTSGSSGLKCRDGTNAASVSHTGGEVLTFASRWSGVEMEVSCIENSAWKSNITAYDGSFVSNGTAYIGLLISDPMHISSVEVFDVDLGQAWLEDNR